jgi:hypothetical protein
MMEDNENRARVEIFSKAVRAGKRTYFFDVKATQSNQYYLTITESKKRFDEEGKFHYEKHKIFLYKEDFDKFVEGLSDVIEFIKTGKKPEVESFSAETTSLNDVNFEDLENDSKK